MKIIFRVNKKIFSKFSLFFFIGLLIFLSSNANGQERTPLKFLKYMHFLDESPTMLDVSYAIVECESEAKIFVEVMNEYHEDQTASITILLTDQSSKAKQEITIEPFLAKRASSYWPSCNDSKFGNLIFNLNPDMNPMYTEAKVIFN